MLPHVILHNTVSLDGRVDGFAPDIAQFYELASHWREDATVAGSQTICRPSEAVPPEEDAPPPQANPGDTRPLLVVPDSQGRVRNWHVLRQAGFWREMVALCSRATPSEYLRYLDQRGVHCVVAGDAKVDLRAALEELNRRFGVKVVRVDSGGTLNGVLLRAGLVHEVSVLINPCLVGGTTPRSIFRAPDLASSEGALPLQLTAIQQLKENLVWLRYRTAAAG
jgi:2,5-diamino-6-(ribosylamino)-4(3H)-pyrimidinone 5'-phosphate reductase